MPKFVIPKREDLLVDLHSIDFRTQIDKTSLGTTFSTKSIYINDNFWDRFDKDTIEVFSKAVQKAALQEGGIITFEEAARLIAMCGPWCMPLEIRISDRAGTDFSQFIEKVNTLSLPHSFNPAEYEKYLHFYVGRKTNTDNFNIVIVPAFKKISGDLSVDPFVESKIFTANFPFFAYVMSADGSGLRFNKELDCIPLLAVKDTFFNTAKPTEVISFKFQTFVDFQNNLDFNTVPQKFFVQFGRLDKDGNLMIVLSFLDSTGPVRSRITAPSPVGVCFDQGDLMPPPDAIIRDSNFS